MEADLSFLEAISSFAKVDFSQSTNLELWYLRNIIETTGYPEEAFYAAQQEDLFTRKRDLDRAFSSNSFMDDSSSSGGEQDGTEDTIQTISPTCVTRKAVKMLSLDGNPHYKNQNAMAIERTSSKSSLRKSGESPSTVAGATYSGLAAGTNGENRLRIHFENLGTRGRYPQRFGKSGCYIPDGLSGTHEMYDQQWRFEVIHDKNQVSTHDEEQTSVQITWRITNLSSGLVVQLKETPQQALLREFSGRTICNKVVKMALSARAEELERMYNKSASTMDSAKRISIENNIRVLRPKLCTVGLLFFGLLHDVVQMHCNGVTSTN